MIIRATLFDNDYTKMIEGFFKRFKFSNYYLSARNTEDLKEYKDNNIFAEALLTKVMYDEDYLSKAEIEKFQEIVKESLSLYLKENNISGRFRLYM